MKFYCPECAKPFNFDFSGTEKEITCSGCRKKFDRPTELGPGIVIGDFLIEKLISRGGMGEVFLARQLSLDRPVALKVLQAKFTGDQEYVDSLFHEARAAAKINHPNIVQAYMVGEEDGIYYFAMEYIRGETFKKILKEKGTIDFVTAAKVIRDVASALDIAWKEQKLVHQDIKPDNIMVDVNGFTKLADLGLAKTAGMDNGDDDADEVLGTPQYISPEQLTGIPTDVRSDLYSLGATFYHFVTGHFAYEAPTAEEITRMHVAGNLTPPKQVNPQLPDALNEIIVKMMARKIEDRYQEPASLIRDLERFLHRSESGNAAPKISLSRAGGKPAPSPAAEKSSAPKLTIPKPAVPKTAVPKTAVPKPAVPKPATEQKTEKSPEQKAPESAPEKSAAASTEEKKIPEKEKMEPTRRRHFIRVGVISGVIGLVILLIAAVITGCILEKKSALPACFVPPVRAINQAVERMLGAARDKAMEMAKPQDFSENAVKETKPTGPRQEYLDMVDEAIVWHNAHSDKPAEFAAKVDALWLKAAAFETVEERNKLEHLAGVFAAIDEDVRCRTARETLRKRHCDRIAEIDAKAREEVEKRKEAERKQEQIRQENEARMRKIAEQRAAEEKERQRINQAESRKMDGMFDAVAEAAVAAVRSNQDGDLKKTIAPISEYRLPAAAIGTDIRKKYDRLQKFCKDSLQAFRTASEYRARLGKIDENSNVSVMFPRYSAQVVSIRKGEIMCRRSNGEKIFMVNLHRESGRTRTSLYKALQRKKFEHPAFYLALFAGEMDAVAEADLPQGYWKENWSLLKKYIH